MNPAAIQLSELIGQQYAAFVKLGDLLTDEHRALQARDREEIDRCGTRRQPLLALIEALDRRLAACIQTLKIEPTRAGVEQFLAKLPSAIRQRACSNFSALRDAADRCRNQNDINGKIVAHNQHNADRILKILSGSSSAGSATYAPDGRVSPQSLSSSIATV